MTNFAVAAFIAKRPRVAYSCSYVLLLLCIPWPWPRTSNYRRVHARVITPCARWRLARVVVYHDLRVQSGIVTRDDRRIDVAFSRCTSSRHSGVVARHPSGWGTSLLEGIFPLNEPIRARLFLLAPRPKSRRHHINKGWAWFEATLPHATTWPAARILCLHATLLVLPACACTLACLVPRIWAAFMGRPALHARAGQASITIVQGTTPDRVHASTCRDICSGIRTCLKYMFIYMKLSLQRRISACRTAAPRSARTLSRYRCMR